MTYVKDPKEAPEAAAVLAIDGEDGWQWGLVEIMGHRAHWCRYREVEQFGAKMIRCDIPVGGDPDKNDWTTHTYSGAAIFGVSQTTRDLVMRHNKPYAPPSIAHYREDDAAEFEEVDGDEED